MTFAAIACAIVFAMCAGFLGVFASRAASGSIPFGVFSPLIGRAFRTDPQKWDRTHRNATPYLWTATGICGIQFLACGAIAAFPASFGPGYLVAIALSGLALVTSLLALAGRL